MRAPAKRPDGIDVISTLRGPRTVITFFGETMTIAEWADEFDIPEMLIRSRLNQGVRDISHLFIRGKRKKGAK
ncbi:hypothetical protein EOS93_23150 [Rhizobium sp. RMa-01]|uniref:hypothetical protein n=1 Tax=unclassified Rhizobium TaxID=2613769 RepID=UPI0008DB05B3|nr:MULTISPECIES: hypothetical protein [unclassified Rhizobium]OHV21431.1 hypothetical protein BBJ66_31205 [Rhizobium sp. RSm-3]RVU08811.1 hypothetical protein EOS93_23150 [Rhizobium sp. RMa-01]